MSSNSRHEWDKYVWGLNLLIHLQPSALSVEIEKDKEVKTQELEWRPTARKGWNGVGEGMAMRGEGSKGITEGKRRQVRQGGRIWMNDVGKGAKMINFLTVTSRALTSLYMTYNKQVKIPCQRRNRQFRMTGGIVIASKRQNIFSYTSFLFLWSHWPLNTSHPTAYHLAIGCCLYLDRCRQRQYIIKFLMSLTKNLWSQQLPTERLWWYLI